MLVSVKYSASYGEDVLFSKVTLTLIKYSWKLELESRITPGHQGVFEM